MSDALPELPAPGTILSGKYRVEKIVGVGGMGAVVAAQHLRLGRRVALKLLLPACRKDQAVTARFEREARAAVRLTSPHVARILDVDTLDDGSPFLVMELLQGVALDEELARRGRLPVAEAVGIILDVCSAMAEAHDLGVVHRDLKPANLFLADEQSKRVVKVLDFGISKVKDDVSGSMTSTSSAFGTPLYMSPEQVQSSKHVDERTDIWSLGVVLYEMITGEAPFEAPSATAVLAAIAADHPKSLLEARPEVPPGLSVQVMKALEKAPEKRQQTVRQFAAAVERYRDDSTSPSTMMSLTSIPPPAPTSRWKAPVVVGVALCVVGGLAAFGVVRGFASRPVAGPSHVAEPAEHVAVTAETPAAPLESNPPTHATAEPSVAPSIDAPIVAPSAEVSAAPTASASAAAAARGPAPRVAPRAAPASSPRPRPPQPVEAKPASKDDPTHL